MGSQLVWQERFNIGVDYIDEEQQKTFWYFKQDAYVQGPGG